MSSYQQPIIRGIEAVGSVFVRYRYNGGSLTLPNGLMQIGDSTAAGNNVIDFSDNKFVDVAGFRLDSNFLRANPQIASSFMIPILGGGALALTNNNRSGVLTINCTRVSTPLPGNGVSEVVDANGVTTTTGQANTEDATGSMYKPAGLAIGPQGGVVVYDLVLLAQAQQGQVGGDSQGSTIRVGFEFCGLNTVLEFQGCTIATVDPIGLSGNDAVDYGVTINYLNWTAIYSSQNTLPLTD